MKRHLLYSVATLTLTSLVASQAYAQVIPPNTARPEVQQRQLQIQDTMPTVSGAPLIMLEDTKGVRQIKGSAQFVLKDITFEGATVYSESELEHIYKDYIGEKISLDTLNKIAADITSYYRNNGYILTRAVIPPQRINGNGAVKIRIVEGFIDQVRIEGDGANDELIQAYGEKIRGGKPLDVATLERYLLLMDDLPGVDARAVLQASPDVQGASDLVVNVSRQKQEFSATLDNRGSRFLGPYQLGLTAAFNNAFGLNDQTQFRLVNTFNDELVYGEVRHEKQLGEEGTKMVFSVSEIQTRPSFTLEAFDIVGESTALSVGASHPILRSRRSNWFVNGDFTARNVNVDSLSSDLYYDKTRVVNLGTSYDFVDSLSSVNRIEAKLSKGFGFNTDVDGQFSSRGNGEESFYKIFGKASRIQPLWGAFSLFGAASGQWSDSPLLASEEFAIGGAEFGSAYDTAELSGDHGAAARMELQYNQAEHDFFSQYQLYAFYDLGRVWNKNPIAGSEEEHTSLASTGVGMRFNLNESVSGGIEGTVPLTKPVSARGNDGDDKRVFFNLQYRY